MDRVEEFVYISDRHSVESGNLFVSNDIGRVLTVDILPISRRWPNVEYFFIHAQDVPSWSILPAFEESTAYIEKAVDDCTGVVVHCQMGISRSATLVAAYLMKKWRISADEAISRIRRVRPYVCPNSGFLEQLNAYYHCGWRVDLNSVHVKRYQNVYSPTNGTHAMRVGKATLVSLAKNQSEHKTTQLYRCRSCRRTLFTDSALTMDHGQRDAKCSESFFIVPVEWMEDCIQAPEGKIHCPQCRGRLGSFKWSGLMCGCGNWITPAFTIQKCKLDEDALN